MGKKYLHLCCMEGGIKQGNQVDKYRLLIEKLIQLEPNDRPNFQEQLKNLHLDKIHKTEAQI